MTLGERIKQLRTEKNLSQPMLAEAAVIEQSYLSKLENDKSQPSNEVLRRLLTALEIDLGSFLSGFEPDYVQTQLGNIADVENWLLRQRATVYLNSRRWLLSSSLLVVLAATFFYAGFSKILFGETHYRYEAKGIVLPGEPADYFEGGMHRSTPREEWDSKRSELSSRYQPDQLILAQNQGAFFTRPVDGGSRTYYQKETFTQPRAENTWLQIAGVLLFTSGITGFLLENRLSRRR